MSRKLRIQHPGAICRPLSPRLQRGKRDKSWRDLPSSDFGTARPGREAIFRDDQDRQELLGTLAETCGKTERQIHADCLMSNSEQLRRYWVLGSEAFRRELLAAAAERLGPSHFGGQRQETEVQNAERRLRTELGQVGWKEQTLRLLPKGHPRKVEIAQRLREEITLSLKWIAARLHMGTSSYVSNLLRAPNREPSTSQGPLPLCQ